MCLQTGSLTLRLPAAEQLSPEEAQALQALSEKLQAEIQVLASICVSRASHVGCF